MAQDSADNSSKILSEPRSPGDERRCLSSAPAAALFDASMLHSKSAEQLRRTQPNTSACLHVDTGDGSGPTTDARLDCVLCHAVQQQPCSSRRHSRCLNLRYLPTNHRIVVFHNAQKIPSWFSTRTLKSCPPMRFLATTVRRTRTREREMSGVE